MVRWPVVSLNLRIQNSTQSLYSELPQLETKYITTNNYPGTPPHAGETIDGFNALYNCNYIITTTGANNVVPICQFLCLEISMVKPTTNNTKGRTI